MIRTKSTPAGWLAFELNVLQRLEFSSVAMPLTGDPSLGLNLKRRGIRISANDVLRSAWTTAVAAIQNNSEKLTDEDVNTVLEDVYVPGHKLRNPALRGWFGEVDAWWFDNVRQNLDKLNSPFAFALAASVAMAVGDYVLSFTEETRELRQPLSNVFRRLWTIFPEPVNNGQNNTCQNQSINEFLAESRGELMFLRLPAAATRAPHGESRSSLWREEWLRGGNEFWGELEASRSGKLGMPVETKSQYLQQVEDTLSIASNIRSWAIAHVEAGFVSTQELLDVIGRLRKVETIYTKDFSELTGAKAVIITA